MSKVWASSSADKSKVLWDFRAHSNSLPLQLTLGLLSPYKVFMHTEQQLSWALDTHTQHERNICSPLGAHSDKHACWRNTCGTMRARRQNGKKSFFRASVKKSDPLFQILNELKKIHVASSGTTCNY